MPCTYTGSVEGDLRYYLSQSREQVTQVAQLLCKACALLEKEKIKLPKDLKTWWIEHQKIDARSNPTKAKSSNPTKAKSKKITKKVR